MPTNNFIQFDSNKTNMMTDKEYTNNIEDGISSNTIADSKLHNKLFYQVSTMAHTIGQYILSKGYDSLDSDVDTLKGNIENALKSTIYESMTATSNGGGGTISMR